MGDPRELHLSMQPHRGMPFEQVSVALKKARGQGPSAEALQRDFNNVVRLALGHSRLNTTEIYAEPNHRKKEGRRSFGRPSLCPCREREIS